MFVGGENAEYSVLRFGVNAKNECHHIHTKSLLGPNFVGMNRFETKLIPIDRTRRDLSIGAIEKMR